MTLDPEVMARTQAALIEVRTRRQEAKGKEQDLVRKRTALVEQLRDPEIVKNKKRHDELSIEHSHTIFEIGAIRPLIKFLADEQERGIGCLAEGKLFEPKNGPEDEDEDGERGAEDDRQQARIFDAPAPVAANAKSTPVEAPKPAPKPAWHDIPLGDTPKLAKGKLKAFEKAGITTLGQAKTWGDDNGGFCVATLQKIDGIDLSAASKVADFVVGHISGRLED